jgi:hypothetical protein
MLNQLNQHPVSTIFPLRVNLPFSWPDAESVKAITQMLGQTNQHPDAGMDQPAAYPNFVVRI